VIHDRDYSLFGLLDLYFILYVLRFTHIPFVRIVRCAGEDSS
jgi:hypothetical protein